MRHCAIVVKRLVFALVMVVVAAGTPALGDELPGTTQPASTEPAGELEASVRYELVRNSGHGRGDNAAASLEYGVNGRFGAELDLQGAWDRDDNGVSARRELSVEAELKCRLLHNDPSVPDLSLLAEAEPEERGGKLLLLLSRRSGKASFHGNIGYWRVREAVTGNALVASAAVVYALNRRFSGLAEIAAERPFHRAWCAGNSALIGGIINAGAVSCSLGIRAWDGRLHSWGITTALFCDL